MSVLVFVPINDGKATKAGLEAASYANAISGGSATAVVAGVFFSLFTAMTPSVDEPENKES